VSDLVRSEPYYHLCVRNETGGTERWLLTDNEIERIRDRSRKHPEMLLPLPEPEGLFARWVRWIRG
jgi:hypothetical protein